MIDSGLPVREQIEQLIEYLNNLCVDLSSLNLDVSIYHSPIFSSTSGYGQGHNSLRKEIIILLQCILNSEDKS